MDYSRLAVRALAVRKAEEPRMRRYKDQGTIDAFNKSYEDTDLNKLDEEFYELEKKEPLDQLCIRYIRSHPEAFTTN
jgi:hypothetical protein